MISMLWDEYGAYESAAQVEVGGRTMMYFSAHGARNSIEFSDAKLDSKGELLLAPRYSTNRTYVLLQSFYQRGYER